MNDLTPKAIDILYLKGMLNDRTFTHSKPDNNSGVGVVPENFGAWLKQQTKEVK